MFVLCTLKGPLMAPDAFVISYEPKLFKGGFMASAV